MKEIRTEIEIDAPPSVVWDVLTGLEAYPEWNPHVTAAAGDLRDGGELRIRVKPSGARSRDIGVTVDVLESPHSLGWTGSIGHPWLFTGEHTFELHDLGGGRTHFVNRERISGLLARLVVDDDTPSDYEGMNRALRERAEARVEGTVGATA